VRKVVEKPWVWLDDGILSERRINQLSVAKLKEEYFKLGEVMKESRVYCRYQSYRIRGYQARLKKRKRVRIARLRRRVLKASYIRKRVREQHRVEIRKAKALLKKKAAAYNKQSVSRRLARAKLVIPRRIEKHKKRLMASRLRQLNRSRKTIQHRLSIRTRRQIFKATALAKENAFIGLIKKEKLPGIGRYLGIYAMIIRRVSIVLKVRFDRLCFLLWIGNFESFNAGSLGVMYPGLGRWYINVMTSYFERMEYIQQISTFRRRKVYAFTPLGKEFYDRIVRYLKKFKKPYRGKKITKKIVRVHFKMDLRAKS
jgi:hypothetical protein